MTPPYNKHFDLSEGITYLTTPGSGLLSRETKAWRRQRDHDFFTTESDLREQQIGFLNSCRQTIAGFVNYPSENIFLSSNFSSAYNTLLDGLPKDYRILLLQNDYPSVNFPVISRAFDHRFVELNENVEINIRDAVRVYKPHVLILSIVQYISGLKIDMNFIKELKSAHPELIIIGDGTQLLGTDLLDFGNSGLDALIASGYKWLMAGYGNGFIVLSDLLKNTIYRKAQGQTITFEKMWEGKSILQLYFEPGHVDTLSHGTLQQSLKQLQEWDLKNILSHTKPLIQEAKLQFAARDLLLPAPRKRAIQSAIFNIQIAPSNFELLQREGIKCFPRGTGIRVGFHLYNSEADLAKLLHIIDHQIKKS